MANASSIIYDRTVLLDAHDFHQCWTQFYSCRGISLQSDIFPFERNVARIANGESFQCGQNFGKRVPRFSRSQHRMHVFVSLCVNVVFAVDGRHMPFVHRIGDVQLLDIGL